MAYHNQKMTEINKIICELWRDTYRGNGKLWVDLCSAIGSMRRLNINNFIHTVNQFIPNRRFGDDG